MASPCWERFYPPGITADFVPPRETRVSPLDTGRGLVFRSDLPKTSVGKYSRKMLRDQDAANGME